MSPASHKLRHEAIPLQPNPWKKLDSKDDIELPQEVGNNARMTAGNLWRATNSCIGTSWWERSSNLTKAHLLMAPRQWFLGSEPCVQPNPNRSIFPSSHQTASRCPSERGFSSATAASANSCKMFALATSLGGFLGPGSPPSFPCPPRDEQTSTGTQTVKLEKG